MVTTLLLTSLAGVAAVALAARTLPGLRHRDRRGGTQYGVRAGALLLSMIALPLAAHPVQTAARIAAAPVHLENLGPAPDLRPGHWLNSRPLTLRALRGQVVLIHFWTFDCINCIHTLPYVTAWYDKYHKQGFTVIGVHTPEFAFERVTANVASAISMYHIHYPVLQDNNYATWNAYSNQYWPAFYLIDGHGIVRYSTYGEGGYDQTESAIRILLGAVHRRA